MENIEKEIKVLKDKLIESLNDFRIINKGISLDITIKSIIRESPIACEPNKVISFDIDIKTIDWSQDAEYLLRMKKTNKDLKINRLIKPQ